MPAGSNLTPREIVSELDRYIVGQSAAKRAVAIALRNRWRRQRVRGELKDEITPKNIILIGPTGVGKTEIARRLARLAQAPFVKVEASKFTEVGYVGRDVESMVRDLVEASIALVREDETAKVSTGPARLAEDRLVELLAHGAPPPRSGMGFSAPAATPAPRWATPSGRSCGPSSGPAPSTTARWSWRSPTRVRPSSATSPARGWRRLGSISPTSSAPCPGSTAPARRTVTVPEALELLSQEEAGRMVDQDRVNRDALVRAESSGIIFIDEIDKIASREGALRGGPDVSREGVQRDILPIVEGSTVTTKYGQVKTDHVLFIAAGAFHVSKPSDLIPELQGRFPIRVELEPLRQEDLVRILKEPRNSLIRQYTALLETEGVSLHFTDDAVVEVARIAALVNSRSQDIGARRLHTILERLLDPVSFEASDPGRARDEVIDAAVVKSRLKEVVEDEDLSRYIL